MLRKYLPLLLNTDSAPGLPAGQSGAGSSQNPRDVLAEMVALRESPPSPENEDSPPAGTTPAPEEPEAPPAQGEPGEAILPEEGAPAVEGDEPAAEGEPENEDPQPGDEKALPESVQKRIDKLTAQKYQAQEKLDELTAETERLRQENEELRNGGAAAPPYQNGLPESVSKLKTPAEVQARLTKVDAQLDALQDFLDANPGTAETVHQVGDKQMTRQELLNWRAELRTEAKALPQRSQQLTSAAQFTQQRKAMAAKIAAEFPQLKDAEHPDTKMARQLLKDPRFADVVEADYLALAMATGHRVLQAEKAKRSTPGGAAAKPLGSKVPLKPAANGSPKAKVESPKPNGAATATGEEARKVLEGIGNIGSRDSLAKLLETTNR